MVSIGGYGAAAAAALVGAGYVAVNYGIPAFHHRNERALEDMSRDSTMAPMFNAMTRNTGYIPLEEGQTREWVSHKDGVDVKLRGTRTDDGIDWVIEVNKSAMENGAKIIDRVNANLRDTYPTQRLNVGDGFDGRVSCAVATYGNAAAARYDVRRSVHRGLPLLEPDFQPYFTGGSDPELVEINRMVADYVREAFGEAERKLEENKTPQ